MEETRAEWERCYNDVGVPIDIEGLVEALAQGHNPLH